jgi:uncharacterized protein YgiM (DUF1202 family)
MKKTITLLFLLAVVAGFYAMTAKAQGKTLPVLTATAQPSPPITPTKTESARVCTVRTGISNGKVNLRACPGSMCGAVLDILTEGESLTILTAGDYVNVTTESGVTGWLNSKYCKGK